MNRFRKVLLLIVSLALLFGAACAEGQADAVQEKVVEGFTVRPEGETCVVTDVADSEIRDGTLIIPPELDGMRVTGFLPRVVKDAVQLMICHRDYGIIVDEDTAPDTSLRYNTLFYAGFKELDADQLDRLPDMQKGEYALTDFLKTVVSRNGSVSFTDEGTGFLFEEDIPQELFGRKAYSLINPNKVARTEGEWTYTLSGDSASIRRWSGEAGGKVFLIPNSLGGLPVQSYELSVIPDGAEIVLQSADCWPRNVKTDAEKKDLTLVEYVTYEQAERNREYLLTEVPDFAEGEILIENVSRVSFTDSGMNQYSFEGLIDAADLPREIDGKKVARFRTDRIAFTYGDWKYVIENGTPQGARIVGYTGTAESALAVPDELDGLPVRWIQYTAVPDEARHVYLPDACSVATGNQYGIQPSDKSFLVLRYVSYEKAAEYNYTSMMENSPSFTAGTYAVRDTMTFKYNAARKTQTTGGTNDFIRADDLLAEINGAPLTYEPISEKLTFRQGELEYTRNKNGEIYYITGPAVVDGNMMMISGEIEGLTLKGVYMNSIPENIDIVMIPDTCSSRTSGSMSRKLRVYYYTDYDSIHKKENISGREWEIRPGEIALRNAHVYTENSSDNLVQEYYEYPTVFNGRKVHIQLYERCIKQYTSGLYTYYKPAENEACICAFSDKQARKVTVPDKLDQLTVTGISSLSSSYVFNTSDATEFVLPSSLRVLGYYALNSGVRSFKTLNLPAGLKELGSYAIHIWNLQTLNLPAGLESWGAVAVYSYRLNKLVIPDSVTRIAGNAFQGLSRLAALTLPAGLTYIPENMCCDCGRLTAIVIPAGVTEIGRNAFAGCSRLGKVTFQGTALTKIGDSAFIDCAVKKLDLPEGIEEIGYQTFYGCKGLGAFVVPSTVKTIGERAFGGCKALTKLTVGENVTQIADNAFEDGAKKMVVTAPENSYAATWAAGKGHTVRFPK